ncbi:hypothetical protein, partial [Roseovarius autotrophicus]|uniref:hypothetical protein n=1 Tax=Roseovarius autotrophicus TaxID=2824121 RepID=UPI001B36C05A
SIPARGTLKAAQRGLTHDRTRSHAQKVKIFLAQREASTHGFRKSGFRKVDSLDSAKESSTPKS